MEPRLGKTRNTDIICYLVAKGAPDDGGHVLRSKANLRAFGCGSGDDREKAYAFCSNTISIL